MRLAIRLLLKFLEYKKKNVSRGCREEGDLVGWEGEESQGVSLFDLVEGKLEKRGIKKEPGLMSSPQVKAVIQKYHKHLAGLRIQQVSKGHNL